MAVRTLLGSPPHSSPAPTAPQELTQTEGGQRAGAFIELGSKLELVRMIKTRNKSNLLG